jgi:hypothetical protein
MKEQVKIYYRESSSHEWKLIDPSQVTGELRGSLWLEGQAKLDALQSVGGSLWLYGTAKLDALQSVGGSLVLDRQAKLDALQSVGGSLRLYGQAKLDAPNLQSVGGYLLLYGQAKLDAPNLQSVGGDLLLYGQAKLDALTDLRPWQEEMAECERIFNEVDPQPGDWCAWLHHEITFEKLSEPWRSRFNYVRDNKPQEELAWRFRLMRPASLDQALAALRTRGAEVQG